MYNRISITFLITLSVLIINRCDCPVHVTGTVLDSKTKLPIENVAIGRTDTTNLNNPFNRKVYTDANGNFQFDGIAGKCDKVLLYFSAENYKIEKIAFDNNSIDTIFMMKN